MQILYFFSLLALWILPCDAAIEPHLRKVEHRHPLKQIKNIDCIYLLNLDERPEKFHACMSQLAPYGIFPERVSSIYGWRLTKETLDEIGLVLTPGMKMQLVFLTSEVMIECRRKKCEINEIPLEDLYGQTIFSAWTSLGAVGCTLSHLSAIKDGYDAGYEAIWVMEDDIHVDENPRQLTKLIAKLDDLVGPAGWDVLYTDCIFERCKTEGSLVKALPWMWRPDVPLEPKVQDYHEVGADFVKIGNRIGAHSLVIRRCGMKKILDFYRKHQIYVPYDHELSLIPDIRLFVTKKSIVTARPGFSDTKNWAYY